IGVNGSAKYDVVSMVEVELLFDHPLRYLLYNDYVFLFSTMLDQDENSPRYGHVNIDLIRHDHLSYFNYHLRTQGEFHVLKNESLSLNDFLESVSKKTKEGLVELFAQLKEQNIIEKDLTTVRMTKNFKVLLFKES